MENEQADSKKKSSSLVMTIAGVAILTLLGAGAGWFVGGMVAPKIAGAETAAKASEAAGEKGGKGGEGIEKISAEANGIVQLDPITTNLAYPATNWVRLEVALMFKGPVEVGLAEDIHQDIMAYVRTVSLQQLEGPRGFQYLKDDIQERVDLRSQGRVSKVMFRTFVIE
ncbi:MAG TPA: flagellar basal body protein FliL [Agrobacterium sp.]|nr:flagellar basal body protein FliL [Agrobacterium sp.]